MKFYAKGRKIYHEPVQRMSGTTMGFLVATVDEYVIEPEQAAADIAVTMNIADALKTIVKDGKDRGWSREQVHAMGIRAVMAALGVEQTCPRCGIPSRPDSDVNGLCPDCPLPGSPPDHAAFARAVEEM